MKDLKEALGNARKPDITHVRKAVLNYIARACEYGDDKYERANYLRRTAGGTAADFVRFRAYLRAAVSHLVDVLDSMEAHQANDPHLEDIAGMIAACFCADTDRNSSFPASELPHVAHAGASIMMAICQAVDAELLPKDPGKPWAFDTSGADEMLEQMRAEHVNDRRERVEEMRAKAARGEATLEEMNVLARYETDPRFESIIEPEGELTIAEPVPPVENPLPGEAPVCAECGLRIYGDECKACRAAKTIADAQAAPDPNEDPESAFYGAGQ